MSHSTDLAQKLKNDQVIRIMQIYAAYFLSYFLKQRNEQKALKVISVMQTSQVWGSTVVRWFALSPHSNKGQRLFCVVMACSLRVIEGSVKGQGPQSSISFKRANILFREWSNQQHIMGCACELELHLLLRNQIGHYMMVAAQKSL